MRDTTAMKPALTKTGNSVKNLMKPALTKTGKSVENLLRGSGLARRRAKKREEEEKKKAEAKAADAQRRASKIGGDVNARLNFAENIDLDQEEKARSRKPPKLTAQEKRTLEDIRSAFQLFDADNSGFIEAREMYAVGHLEPGRRSCARQARVRIAQGSRS